MVSKRAPSLRNQVATLRAQLESLRETYGAELHDARERARRAEDSAESFQRTHAARLQQTELECLRQVNEARTGEAKALRELTAALTTSALHTDNLIATLSNSLGELLEQHKLLDTDEERHATRKN